MGDPGRRRRRAPVLDVDGRAPIDAHLRGPAGGLRTGGLLTNLDSLGGFTSGLAVLPRWIVTTSLLATVSELDHVGPLRFGADVLRRGRTSVVTALDVVDEGAHDRHVAAATMTCAVLDPGAMALDFDRPVVVAMPPPQPDAGPARGVLLHRARRGPGHPAPVGRPAPQSVGDPPRRGGGHAGRRGRLPGRARRTRGSSGPAGVAAADAVLHYLRPVKVGPVEARCQVLGTRAGRTTVRVAIHDVGADDRMVTLGSVTVLAV